MTIRPFWKARASLKESSRLLGNIIKSKMLSQEKPHGIKALSFDTLWTLVVLNKGNKKVPKKMAENGISQQPINKN